MFTIANILDDVTQEEEAAHYEVNNQPLRLHSTFFAQFIIVIIVIIGVTTNIFIDRFDILTASYYHISINKPKEWRKNLIYLELWKENHS
jgi:hypothetical protein